MLYIYIVYRLYILYIYIISYNVMHIRLALRSCRPVAGDETTRNFCDSPKPIAPDCLGQ